MSTQALQDYVFVTKYSRYRPDLQRRETYDEAVERVVAMHRQFYGPKIEAELRECETWMKARRILGSQRALQFGGDPILRKHLRGYNCLHRSTRFITAEGVKSFEDFRDGDAVTVLAPSGAWRKAVVRSYGRRPMQRVTIKRRSSSYEVLATPDHAWISDQGDRITSLTVGQRLQAVDRAPFHYADADLRLKVAWAYGFVYGDGTCVKGKDGRYSRSAVRLCDKKRRFKSRFEDIGFAVSSPKSMDGDFMAYTGSYLKTTPNLSCGETEELMAFVDGLLCADGARNSNAGPASADGEFVNEFLSIQATGAEKVEFLRRALPAAGWYIVSEHAVTGRTNYGERSDETVSFRIINQLNARSIGTFEVASLSDAGEHEAWCLEVEEEHAFVLPNGLVTGNCSFSYCDRPRFFQEALWALLCGCGVGFSVQHQHVRRLPELITPAGETVTFVVPDTIEGWSDALGMLLASYGLYADDSQPQQFTAPATFAAAVGRPLHLDYSLVRPKGAPLSSGSGKAPGPEPLRKSLGLIRQLLHQRVLSGAAQLRPIDAYDIVMHASDAVLSGGVRRSASLALFSPTDHDMLHAKTGNWFETNPQRGRSNNSAVLLRNQTTPQEFRDLVSRAREFGEPGFVWVDDLDYGVNPCCEIGAYARDDLGRSGWQLCNLSEVNLKACDTADDFVEACRRAAWLGTLQAGYTDFAYLGPVTESITRREALLGVSITGIMEKPDLLFAETDALTRGARAVLDANAELAAKIGINPAARATCIKPSGTASCLLGTSSGIHAHHARRYFRRAQGNELEAPLQFFQLHNPECVEPSVWSANGTDRSVIFCIETPESAIVKDDLKAVDLLEYVRKVQQRWVAAGRRPERCVRPWLTHNVSNTVNVRPDEWDAVVEYIYGHRQDLTGVALLGHEGDKDYPQAPFCQVYTPEEIVAAYGDGALLASGLIVDGLHAFGNNLWQACDVALGTRSMPAEPRVNDFSGCLADYRDAAERWFLQADWVRRARKFATNYFRDDLRLMTYCLKDVSNWKLWVDLRRSYRPVDWSKFVELSDATASPTAEAACAGGQCNVL